MNLGRAFTVAWRILPKFPEGFVHGVFQIGGDVLWLARTDGVRQLEKNLRRVLPDADKRELRRACRMAVRSYAQYYAEIFTMPGMSAEEVERRVRFDYPQQMQDDLAVGSVVLALGHTGNWDLAAVRAVKVFATVLAVVEVLEPREIFEDFLEFRTGFGMEIIPLVKGANIFRQLRTRAREDRRLVALLADRDLTRNGVEVDLVGHRARVAVGPAALAHSLRIPLYFVGLRHERVAAPKRFRPNRTVSGLYGEYVGPISVEPGPNAVERLSQAWTDVMSQWLLRHPESWHMLQKVFVDDLDQDRLVNVERT